MANLLKNWYLATEGDLLPAGEYVCESSEAFHSWAESVANGGTHILIFAEDEEKAQNLCDQYNKGLIEIGNVTCAACGQSHGALSE